jgi:chlorite dismutase
MTDQKLQAVADSAWLKVAQYAITGVALPMVLWFGARALDDLEKIKGAMNTHALHQATTELRLQALEKSAIDRDAAVKALAERVGEQGYEIRRLREGGKH